MRGDRLRGIALKRQAVTFVVLAYAFSWGIWGVGYLAVPDDVPFVPVVFLGVFGPAVAAALTVRLTGDAVRSWLTMILNWRVAPRWYFAAFLVPVGMYGLAAVVVVFAGATVQGDQFARGFMLSLGSFPTAMLISGGNEELGWRGYLLPRVQQEYDALTASLIVGIVWAGWHLPVYVLPLGLTNGPFYLFVPFAVLLSVVLTWVYNNTDGSALLAMVMHGSVNSALGIFVSVLTLDAVSETVLWGARIIGVFCVAVILTAVCGPRTLIDGDPQTESPSATAASTAREDT